MLENFYKDNEETLNALDYPPKGMRTKTWVQLNPDLNCHEVKYFNVCNHCGVRLVTSQGLSAHMRSVRCIAERVKCECIVKGYKQALIQYNKYTSPFARTFPTKFDKGTKPSRAPTQPSAGIGWAHGTTTNTITLNSGTYTTMKAPRPAQTTRGCLRLETWYEGWFVDLWEKHRDPYTGSYPNGSGTPQEPKQEYKQLFEDLANARRKGKLVEPIVAIIEMKSEGTK